MREGLKREDFFYYGKSLRSRGKTWKSEDWSGDLLTTELNLAWSCD